MPESISFLGKIISDLEKLESSSSETDLRSYLQNDIAWLFQRALLSGEYYENTLEKLRTIQTLLSNIEAKEKKSTLIINGKTYKINSSNTDISLIREQYVQLYLDLVQKLEAGVKNLLTGQKGKLEDITGYEAYAVINQLVNVLETDSVKKARARNYNTFIAGILLVYLDEYLECNEKNLEILRRLQSYLSRFSANRRNQEIINLYKFKAEYLEYKIEFRNSHHTKDGEKGNTGAPNFDGANPYNAFREKTISHYNMLEFCNPDIFNSHIDRMLEVGKDEFNIEILHNFNRYYSKISTLDFASRKKNIDILIERLQDQESRLVGESEFDKIAFKSIQALLANSSFHLELKMIREQNFHEIISHFAKYLSGKEGLHTVGLLSEKSTKCENLAKSNKFKDFYCYVIFIKFLNSLNNYILENAESLLPDEKDVDVAALKRKFKNIISYLQAIYLKAVENLKEYLGQIRTYEAKPVYLTLKECYINYPWAGEESEGQLFLDSSYVLPNNFEKISQKAESWEAFIVPQMKFLEESFDIALNRADVKKNISTFEEKMKGNEFRVIQTVALFVSITTFVLINVKIFDNRTGLESFAILIGLAACFFLFNLFLFYMVFLQLEGRRRGLGTWVAAILLLLAPVLLGQFSYSILTEEKYNVETQVQNFKKQLDTLPALRELQRRIEKDSIEMVILKAKVKQLATKM